MSQKSISICPPSVRMICVVCANDSVDGHWMLDVVALRSTCNEDGPRLVEAIVHEDNLLASPEEIFDVADGICWRLVVAPWPRDQDEEKCKPVVNSLRTLIRNRLKHEREKSKAAGAIS